MKKLFLGFFAIYLLTVAQAFALDLQSARDSGLVGETQSGYIAAVSGSPSSDVAALVNEVNSARKAEFEAISKRTGQSADIVAKLAGEKLIRERLTAGQYYQNQNGNWVKK